jgi:hypothetical protein
VRTLVAQRVLGIAGGYEELNDYDALRTGPLWAPVVRKLEAKRARCAPRDRQEHAQSPGAVARGGHHSVSQDRAPG